MTTDNATAAAEPVTLYPNLHLLSRILGKPISFYDLETTGLLSDPNFGICEIGALVITGDAVVYKGGLVNPGKPISPGAEATHGISNDMVKDLPNLVDSGFLKFFSKLVSETYLAGFNNKGFDDNALKQEFVRMNEVMPHIESFDIREWHNNITSQDSYGKGKLVDALALHGIAGWEGDSHRVEVDIRNTAALAENLAMRMLAFGLGARKSNDPGVISSLEKKETEVRRTRVLESLLQDLAGQFITERDICKLASEQNNEISAVGEYEFLLSKVVLSHPEFHASLAEPVAQGFLDKNLANAIRKAWGGDQTGPTKEVMLKLKYEKGYDYKTITYSQLHIANAKRIAALALNGESAQAAAPAPKAPSPDTGFEDAPAAPAPKAAPVAPAAPAAAAESGAVQEESSDTPSPKSKRRNF